ncbi:solute:Na+ symporter, SSS family [Burkholderia pseudomallei]|nr:solute:Na+ symporter, SSS family [Burkholderia pseudomallei]CAJ8051178.1 solute:Na+ symporter, SSS family [Burkholderia pseudomallei]
MSDRTLKSVQIASLLVSTSCGTGFLLGTGELALREGMVGCLYAIASALGMVALAACTRGLSITRQSIWTRLDQIYGTSVGRAVALLSLVWMTGVLAAQIRGGTAILTLAGIGPTPALLLVDVLLICLSTLRLSWLAAGFAICMLACNVVLVRALFLTGGLDVWLHAPVQFLDGLQGATLDRTGFTVASVVLMVICGADYQQFVLAARTPAMARNGCLLAAGCVFLIGFLPASAVIAASPVWHLRHLADPVQVIPAVLMHTLSGHSASKARMLVIVVLLTTALGAGCSILRAMTDATASLGSRSSARTIWSRILPIALGTIVAVHGQSLVDMMVDLNMVYLTAVGPLVGLALLNRRIPDRCANATLAIAGSIAAAIYFVRWTGLTTFPATNPLIVPLLPLVLISVLLWRRSTEMDS